MQKKGKYCDYYWSVRLTDKGYVWEIRGDWKKGSEVLQSSLDNEDEDEKHYETARAARIACHDTIEEYYDD